MFKYRGEEILKQVKERIQIIDAVRGLAIILMVLHHMLFSLVYIFWSQALKTPPIAQTIFGFLKNVFESPSMEVWHTIFICVFIFIAGVSSRFSRSNLKRGVIIFGLGMLLTIVTVWILPAISPDLDGLGIYFGILHFMGISMMIYAVIGKYLDKIPKIIAPFLYFSLFILTYDLPNQRWSIPNLYMFGFPDVNFASADYFPIFPWIFMFFIGTYVGKFIKEGYMPKWFYTLKIPFLPFAGRNTLIIYVLHQPLVYGFYLLLFMIIAK
jgi:uncharacterized membrane protein